MKIQAIIDGLIQWHQPYENDRTRDTFKAGDPQRECTGIALCCWPSMDVLEKTAELGYNLIICHESLYYGDEFDNGKFSGLRGYEDKKKFIDDHQLTVWRDHDHMHGKGRPWVPERVRNDYIYYGFMKVMGWEDNVVGDRMKPVKYVLKKRKASELARELITKLGLNGLRAVGSLDSEVSTVLMAEHCLGRGDDEKILEACRADVLIPLEIVDWTVTAYIRDAVAAGIHKVILEPGHFNVEEAGMMYMEKWLPEVTGNDIPVKYIRSQDPFRYIVNEK
ncbi:MAG: hypothetical protein IJ252_08615 [Solobacterium sp.]|nr:hypothetical protein [Solobacterium sp.]